MLDYEVIYSKRRTISLGFKDDGTLLLRAPTGRKRKGLKKSSKSIRIGSISIEIA